MVKSNKENVSTEYQYQTFQVYLIMLLKEKQENHSLHTNDSRDKVRFVTDHDHTDKP